MFFIAYTSIRSASSIDIPPHLSQGIKGSIKLSVLLPREEEPTLIILTDTLSWKISIEMSTGKVGRYAIIYLDFIYTHKFILLDLDI